MGLTSIKRLINVLIQIMNQSWIHIIIHKGDKSYFFQNLCPFQHNFSCTIVRPLDVYPRNFCLSKCNDKLCFMIGGCLVNFAIESSQFQLKICIVASPHLTLVWINRIICEQSHLKYFNAFMTTMQEIVNEGRVDAIVEVHFTCGDHFN